VRWRFQGYYFIAASALTIFPIHLTSLLPMKVQMQSVHFDADQTLLDFIQQRLNKLEHFYDRVTDGEVILRLNNKDGVANKTVEIKLMVPGSTLFSQEDAASFEAATDAAVEALKSQIARYKAKHQAQH
jgi:putative sigma-54 modulation protein